MVNIICDIPYLLPRYKDTPPSWIAFIVLTTTRLFPRYRKCKRGHISTANRGNVYDWKRVYFWCRCRLFNFTHMEFSSAYLHRTEFSRYEVFSCIFRIFLQALCVRQCTLIIFNRWSAGSMLNFVFLSLVFDADGENHEAYQEIHNKYKGLVRIIYWLCLRRFIQNIQA